MQHRIVNDAPEEPPSGELEREPGAARQPTPGAAVQQPAPESHGPRKAPADGAPPRPDANAPAVVPSPVTSSSTPPAALGNLLPSPTQVRRAAPVTARLSRAPRGTERPTMDEPSKLATPSRPLSIFGRFRMVKRGAILIVPPLPAPLDPPADRAPEPAPARRTPKPAPAAARERGRAPAPARASPAPTPAPAMRSSASRAGGAAPAGPPRAPGPVTSTSASRPLPASAPPILVLELAPRVAEGTPAGSEAANATNRRSSPAGNRLWMMAAAFLAPVVAAALVMVIWLRNADVKPEVVPGSLQPTAATPRTGASPPTMPPAEPRQPEQPAQDTASPQEPQVAEQAPRIDAPTTAEPSKETRTPAHRAQPAKPGRRPLAKPPVFDPDTLFLNKPRVPSRP